MTNGVYTKLNPLQKSVNHTHLQSDAPFIREYIRIFPAFFLEDSTRRTIFAL